MIDPKPAEATPATQQAEPLQPIIRDSDGVARFKANRIVRYLLDRGPITMNDIAMLPFSEEDARQFAQLIGYSVSGYGELSYAEGHESVARADAIADAILAAPPQEQRHD